MICQSILHTAVGRLTVTILLLLVCQQAMYTKTMLTGKTLTTRDGLLSNRVNDLLQDDKGYIWLGTSNGLSRYDGYSFLNFPTIGCALGEFIGNIGTLSHDSVNSLLWIRTATFNYACYDLKKYAFSDFTAGCNHQTTYPYFIKEPHGVWLYDRDASIRHITFKNGCFTCKDYSKDNGLLPDCKIRRLMVDSRQQVWILTDSGLLRIEADGRIVPVVSGKEIVMCNQWRDKCFFLTQEQHVLIFDLNGKLVKDVSMSTFMSKPEGMNGNFVWCDSWVMMFRSKVVTMDCRTFRFNQPKEMQMEYGIVLDQTGDDYWVSDPNGLLRFFSSTGEIRDFSLIRQSGYTVSRKRMYSTVKGKDGLYYIASYGNGLFIYDPGSGMTTHVSTSDANPILASDYLIDIMADHDGNIWVSQEEAGVVCLSWQEVPTHSHILTGHVRHIREGADGSLVVTSHQGEYTDSLTDKKGRSWTATWERGLLMAGPGGHGGQFLTRSTTESRVNALAIDQRERLWIATYNGLYMLNTKEPEVTDESFRHITWGKGVAANYLATVLAASDGTLWTGGVGTGVIRIDNDGKRNKTITTNQGLRSNNIHSLVEDTGGNIWAATDDAIACINPKTMRVINYQFGTSLIGSLYSDHCAVRLSDGRLAFGTHDGVTVIIPSERVSEAKQGQQLTHRRPLVTALDINGQSVFNGEQYADLRNLEQDYSLEHYENSLTFYFSDFNYSTSGQTMYQFMLEGIDKSWREPTNQSRADYSNLPPGRYVFHVRTAEDDQEATLTIKIRQPWYNSWWAWTLYLIISSAIVWTFYHHKREQLRLRQQMIVEKQVEEFRYNFFTQVAHEFRTPLAIISGAVDKMAETGSTQRKTLQTVKRGMKRLTGLVNQLMEFRKISTCHLRLQIERCDIVDLLRDTCQDFWNAAQQKDLTLSFTPFAKHYEMMIDRHFIETIVYNLVSNAVKYTQQGGCVKVNLRLDDMQLTIGVEDSGPGIDEKRREMLFEPFMHGYASQGGLGIGLFTAYHMAKTHHGSLAYQRSETLGGACFILTIPNDESLYFPDEYKQVSAAGNETPARDDSDMEQMIREMLPNAINSQRIVIIEDDPDMLEQIKQEVGVYFQVTGYTSGAEGIEAIKTERPSLLICDVMLPDMDGYDIVRQLKADLTLRSLPVIMLTALDDERHQVKGYEAGADDYMVKPCNYRILIARTIQLIGWAKEGGEQQPSATGHQPSAIQNSILDNRADKLLLDRINSIIAQHVSDPNFSIDKMAEAMHMGRTKLYGKVKELTGQSPNKLFMGERMRIAAQLIEQGDLNISEVAYRVGFEDTSYFNKCFKQHFGVAPGKYKKQGPA